MSSDEAVRPFPLGRSATILIESMRSDETAVEDLLSDSSLIGRASRGDRAAFGLLYERYARLVHGILLARVPPWDAEDLAQEVFLNAMRKLAGLREPAAFGGWLAALARNRAIEFHRTQRRHPADSLDDHSESFQVRAPDSGDPQALVILDLIRRLPEAYRETLILRLVEGLTGAEIASQCGLTADSVRVNLCRGMKLLRHQLGGAPE